MPGLPARAPAPCRSLGSGLAKCACRMLGNSRVLGATAFAKVAERPTPGTPLLCSTRRALHRLERIQVACSPRSRSSRGARGARGVRTTRSRPRRRDRGASGCSLSCRSTRCWSHRRAARHRRRVRRCDRRRPGHAGAHGGRRATPARRTRRRSLTLAPRGASRCDERSPMRDGRSTPSIDGPFHPSAPRGRWSAR